MTKLKEYIINSLLKLFYYLFQNSKSTDKINPNILNKVLLLHIGNLSESLLVSPFVKIFKQNTNSEIHLICNKLSMEVFQNDINIAKCIETNDSYWNVINKVSGLRRSKYDLIIDLNESDVFSHSIILGFVNSNYKVGFRKDCELLFTHPIDSLNKTKYHKVDRILGLNETFDFRSSKKDANIIYSPTSESEESFMKYLEEKKLRNKLLVCINISSEQQDNYWGSNNYKNILKYLLTYDINIIVTSSVYEIDEAEKIADNNCNTFYNTELSSYASLIKYSDFIFTPDSYTVHLAGSFNKPVFILFKQSVDGEMLNVPYNSDFDFALTEKDNLMKLSYGNVLNSFIPYFDYVYERYNYNNKSDE